MTDAAAIDLIRPFAWLATIAFVVGFLSYLVLGNPTPAQAQADDGAARPAAASGPASKDWNLPKHI